MEKDIILKSEQYMIQCVEDSAHDEEHIYRVANIAMDIAKTEKGVNRDSLLVACLLHDIGRKEQNENPAVCHAQVGAKKAYQFLIQLGVRECEANFISRCIKTHRYRSTCPPETIEEKILFDADTLDATGAMGIARSIAYQGRAGIPLYKTDSNGDVIEGEMDDEGSFFREFHFKLKKIYDGIYTTRGKEIAKERKEAAFSFYEALYREVKAYSGRLNK